jgi:hypothetical protein
VKLRAVPVTPSAFNLGERGGKRLAGGKEALDARALGIEAEAAYALPVGRYPIIRHEIRHFPSRVFFATVVCMNTS